ncbi:MAG: hypothetical protein PVF45_02400 [Anaerolineae bacterium]|jgi:hypothetical protein
MTRCIEPALIKEGDLTAYVEGEADERVRTHVGRCAACADKVARLRQTDQALMALMYRGFCPAPEVLGQYQLDLLHPDEQLRVAAHVRACPHCRRELDELAQEEDSLTHMVLHAIRGAVRVVEGALVAPRLRPAGVRGGEGGQYAFRGAGLDVLVGFQPTVSGRRKGTLVGAVVQAEAVADGRAWLFQEGERSRSSPVDDLGTFTFEGIAPGEYDLALEVGEEALLLREVGVGLERGWAD